MTALEDTWLETRADRDPETVVSIVRTRRHEGYGAAERRPCACRFCGGCIVPRIPHGALETAAHMRAIH